MTDGTEKPIDTKTSKSAATMQQPYAGTDCHAYFTTMHRWKVQVAVKLDSTVVAKKDKLTVDSRFLKLYPQGKGKRCEVGEQKRRTAWLGYGRIYDLDTSG